jgi:hypothetical protein
MSFGLTNAHVFDEFGVYARIGEVRGGVHR